MKKFLALILAAMLVICCTACGTNQGDDDVADTSAAEEAEDTAAAEEGTTVDADFTVGLILLHDENIGYDAAHLEGVKAAFETLGLDTETQLIIKYSIPEDEQCYDAAVDLAEKGCDIIFADSFGHETFLFEAAAEYPDIMFCHATGTAAASSELDNVCNYFTNIFEARYISGIVAGMKLAEMLESGEATEAHVGYVGAYPYAEVKSGYTAFFLGVQAIVPEATMDVIFTNSWADMTAEATAAESLMANGCVIIGQHADTTGAPSTIQAAYESGKAVYSVGYNIDMLSVAPDAALTSAQNNWGALYTELIQTAMEGGEFERDYTVGYAEDGVGISTLGPNVAEGTQESVDEHISAIVNGMHVFDCADWTVNGEHLSTYTTSYGFEGNELIFDGYFHESELRSAPAFDIDIDGINLLS